MLKDSNGGRWISLQNGTRLSTDLESAVHVRPQSVNTFHTLFQRPSLIKYWWWYIAFSWTASCEKKKSRPLRRLKDEANYLTKHITTCWCILYNVQHPLYCDVSLPLGKGRGQSAPSWSRWSGVIAHDTPSQAFPASSVCTLQVIKTLEGSGEWCGDKAIGLLHFNSYSKYVSICQQPVMSDVHLWLCWACSWTPFMHVIKPIRMRENLKVERKRREAHGYHVTAMWE